ncbi:MAG: tRNA (adenosine(37)-N6)-threonylcarbamoyltransferase complex ATPase subunit type 1 TsaE [Clostridia bacterium]|nr:tRNA (adenosine(37)-N6)-threonylcarbamoyltransferase complex ATPase subunit type 1 TsaE [Clostridia bacterium]
MNLVVYLQSLASSTLTLIATIFEFFGQLPFFVLLFALLYLVVNKETGYKFWLTYATGFVVGSLALKNIINRPRPYQAEASLQSMRNAYSSSMPSATAINVSSNASFIYASFKNNVGKSFLKFVLFLVLTLIVLGTCLTQLYFANNFLLDVIIGVAIGFILSLIIIKFVKLSDKTIKNIFLVCFPLLLVSLLFFVKELFTNNFANSAVLEFIGISSSILLGTFVDNKRIKYQIKNNLIFTTFKVAITLIVLVGYNYLCLLLPGIVFFSFLKYFVAGLIVTIILPLLFKKLQKYFYVFSSKVDLSKVTSSIVTTSEKSTKKAAQKIYASLKAGDIVLLSGDLGAGKSVLTRGILNFAGINKNITSPTFTLVNKYENNKQQLFYHFDMYRIEDDEEVINIGFDEILDDTTSIKFIEWPEKVETHLPKNCKKITIVKLGKNSRNIIVEENI